MDDGGIGAIIWAAASVKADGSMEVARGCTVIREALGTYLITLDRSLTEENGVFLFSLGETAGQPRFITHEHPADNQIRVFTTSVAPVPFDHDWHFVAIRVAP